MTSRIHLGRIAVALALLTSGAVVAAGPAGAGTPGCITTVSAVTQDGHLLRREVKNSRLLSEKVTSAPLAYPVYGLVWKNTVEVVGGTVDQLDTFSRHGRPRAISVRNPDGSAVLSLKKSQTYATALDPRAIAGSGADFVYGIAFNNPLARWTRTRDADGSLRLGTLTRVRGNMAGISTLSYSATYEIGGQPYDFLYATTKGGRLLQIRVPWSHPDRSTIIELAPTGFEDVDGLSLSFCNNSPHYLSVLAVDGVTGEARHYTLHDLLHPKQYKLADRGLVATGADWHLHAVV